MSVSEFLYRVGAAVDSVLIAAGPHVALWGPVAAALIAVVGCWWLWPVGYCRRRRPIVRTLADRCQDTVLDAGPDTDICTSLTCTDTCPDMSERTGPDTFGHDGEGD